MALPRKQSRLAGYAVALAALLITLAVASTHGVEHDPGGRDDEADGRQQRRSDRRRPPPAASRSVTCRRAPTPPARPAAPRAGGTTPAHRGPIRNADLRPGGHRHRDPHRRLDVHVRPRRRLRRADRGRLRRRRQLHQPARRHQRPQGRAEDLRRRRRSRQATRQHQAPRRDRQGLRAVDGLRRHRRPVRVGEGHPRVPPRPAGSRVHQPVVVPGRRAAAPGVVFAGQLRRPQARREEASRSSTSTPARPTTARPTPTRWPRTGTRTASRPPCWRRSPPARRVAPTPSATPSAAGVDFIDFEVDASTVINCGVEAQIQGYKPPKGWGGYLIGVPVIHEALGDFSIGHVRVRRVRRALRQPRLRQGGARRSRPRPRRTARSPSATSCRRCSCATRSPSWATTSPARACATCSTPSRTGSRVSPPTPTSRRGRGGRRATPRSRAAT